MEEVSLGTLPLQDAVDELLESMLLLFDSSAASHGACKLGCKSRLSQEP